MDNPEYCGNDPKRCDSKEFCSMRTKRCAPQLELTALEPDNGPTGGGTSIKLVGDNFQTGMTVEIDGQMAAVQMVSQQEAMFTLPAHSGLGAVPVRVHTPEGAMASAAGPFFYRTDNLTFDAPQSYPLTDMPFAMVAGDFAGNSLTDFAVLLPAAGINVLENQGGGNFVFKLDPNPTPNGCRLAAGLLDADLKQDLVVGSDQQGDQEILVKTNMGNGTFSTRPILVGGGPHWFTVADMNQDGRSDIVVVPQSISGVRVLLNDGNGQFTAGNPFAVTTPRRIVTGLFDADNKMDVVVGSGDKVVLLLGSGDGSLKPPQPFDSGIQPLDDLVAADVNRDGKLDILCAGARKIAVLLGDGVGGFAPPMAFPHGDPVNPVDQVAVADLNGDGRPDLSTAAGAVNRSYLFLGDGGGSFMFLKQTLPVSGLLRGIIAVDVNDDKLVDLVGWTEVLPADANVHVSLNASM